MPEDAVGEGVEHGLRQGEHEVAVACELEIRSGLVQGPVECQAVLLQRDRARSQPAVVISTETSHETGTGRRRATQWFTGVDDDNLASSALDQVKRGGNSDDSRADDTDRSVIWRHPEC